MGININDFIEDFFVGLEINETMLPWEITNDLKSIIERMIPMLNQDFNIQNGIAIHQSAMIENGVTIKNPAIIMERCTVKSNAYFREGVILRAAVNIGASCEVKSSVICSNSAVAHLNYIGNSIVGQYVNIEAGAVFANHYNERISKNIRVKIGDQTRGTGVTKFGALVGDHSKIGANAVLSPGTILAKNTIVKRLELVEQITNAE